MSLKVFHLVFILASCALALGCGVYEVRNFFSPGGRALDLLFALACFGATAGLIAYERYFLKKFKNVSFL